MLTFINNRLCPYGHRAWLVLLELGIPFEEKIATIKAGEKEPWFTEIYQKALGAQEGSDGKVPVIDDDGYHRLCAVYQINEDELIPCKIV